MELDARRMNTALHLRCRAVFMRRASRSIRCSREEPISHCVFVCDILYYLSFSGELSLILCQCVNRGIMWKPFTFLVHDPNSVHHAGSTAEQDIYNRQSHMIHKQLTTHSHQRMVVLWVVNTVSVIPWLLLAGNSSTSSKTPFKPSHNNEIFTRSHSLTVNMTKSFK